MYMRILENLSGDFEIRIGYPTLEPDGPTFKSGWQGSGQTFTAKDLDEVKALVAHCFMLPRAVAEFHDDAKAQNKCPICREGRR